MIPGLKIDWDSSRPVYRQIADATRIAALGGQLAPGHRLPATRDLARQLGVNRNTVVAAYEILTDEGWVVSHTGKGTFLQARPRAASPSPRRVAEPEERSWFTAFSRAAEGAAGGGLRSIYRLAIADDGISFVGSYPAGELFPAAGFARAMETTMRELGSDVLCYGPTAGHEPLRRTVAQEMRRRGGDTDPEDVLITSGAQQSLELIFRTLLERGEPVIIEEPTYTGALSILGSLGARVVAVPIDDEGIRPDLLELALERHRPRVMYLQPTFHNPTARVMGEQRRREVLALATRHRCPIVEDDWGSDLRLDGTELPSLHALDGGRHVLYVGTFSKKLMPGIRIGWTVAPRPVLDRLVEMKRIEDCGSSPILQAALHRFLSEGGLAEHLDRVRPAYRERRDCMLAALERHFPHDARWERPAGGLFVWVSLAGGVGGSELFEAARQRGVLYSRGELFHHDGSGGHCIRLTYSAASPSQIKHGVELLGELIRERQAESLPQGRSINGALPIF